MEVTAAQTFLKINNLLYQEIFESQIKFCFSSKLFTSLHVKGQMVIEFITVPVIQYIALDKHKMRKILIIRLKYIVGASLYNINEIAFLLHLP